MAAGQVNKWHWPSSTLPQDGEAAPSSSWSGCQRAAQGRLDFSHRTCRRRNALGQPAVLCRIYSRSHRAAGNGGPLAGATVGARPGLAAGCHGRNGFCNSSAQRKNNCAYRPILIHSRPRTRGQGPGPAGAGQSDPQCDRSDGRHDKTRSVDLHAAGR